MKRHKETALHLAVKKGNLEIVQLLLSDKNIDINNKQILKYKINIGAGKKAQ